MPDDPLSLLDRYQKHIETCAQCREHPDALCKVGQYLSDAVTGTPAPRSKRGREYTKEEIAEYDRRIAEALK